MTDELIADLKLEEGWRSHVYQDSLGKDSIGYGFLLSLGLPKPVGEFWLRYALNERLAELQRRWPPFVSQPPEVQRALGNMAYNLGCDGLLNFKRMLQALAGGKREEAAMHCLDSEYARQVPNRARRVAALLRGAP